MLELEETWFDLFLRYGLYAGAVFQIACIAAIVLLPPRKDGAETDYAKADPEVTAEGVRKSKSETAQKRPKEKKKKK